MHDCPTCNMPCEVTERYVMESTDGPLECITIRCPMGHWFSCVADFFEHQRG